MIDVTQGDPRDPGATALLRASHALMQSLFPTEDNHYLSIDALCAPDIRFFTARRDGATVGCGALALRPGYGELKSMFVDPAARGSGSRPRRAPTPCRCSGSKPAACCTMPTNYTPATASPIAARSATTAKAPAAASWKSR